VEDLSGRTLGRFRLQQRLGFGAVGTVYRAEDLKIPGRIVALKLLRDDDLTIGDRRDLLRTDISALAKLNHPYITALFDVHEEADQFFFSMEYVDGETLADHIKAGPLPLDRVVSIASQIAEALAHAHQRGLIHRDIKPGNIKVSSEGFIKVMDFGLAVLMPRATGPDDTTVSDDEELQPAMPGQLAGTYAYMSPEQSLGWRLDQRSDLFSFGVVLYEMVTGERPFHGTSPYELLQAIREQPTPNISAERVGTPQQLSTIIESCLEKEAADRPSGMPAMLDSLRSLQSVLVAPRARGPARPIPLPPQISAPPADQFRVPFIGRDGERKLLEDVLQGAAARRGSALLIEGEAGIGKSRLTSWGLERVVELGGLRAQGHCVLRGGAPPFHPFVEAAGQLLEQAGLLTTSDLDDFLTEEQIPDPLRPAIRRFLGLFDEPDVSPDQMLAGASQLFIAIANAKGPLLTVVIEDMHWADEATVDLFCFLAHRLADARIALVTTFRPERGDASTTPIQPPHMRMLEQLTSRPGVQILSLDRLSSPEIADLATAALQGLKCDERSREVVFDASGGNPLFALEYLRELQEGGILESGAEGLRLAETFQATAVPRRIQEILERRLDRVGRQEREVLEVAAVQGDFIDPGPIAQALEMSRLELLRAVRSLHGDHHLLVPAEDGFRFDHPQIREVMLQSLGGAMRREIHLLLAEALEKSYGLDEEHAAAIAMHLADGNRELESVAHFMRAAAGASRAQALADAHRYLRRAMRYQLRHDPEGAGRWGLTRQLVEIKHKIGDGAGIKKILKEALEGQPGPPDRSERTWALIALASSHTRLGDNIAARFALEEAESLLPDEGADRLRVGFFFEHANVSLREAGYGEALRYLEQAAALTPKRRSFSAAIRHKIGQVYFLQGDYDRADAEYKVALDEAAACGDQRREGIVFYAMANLERVRGNPAEACRLGERAVEQAERIGDRRGLAHATTNLALALDALGESGRSIELHRRSLALKQELRDPQGESNSLHNLAGLCRFEGKLAEGLGYAKQALRIKRGISDIARLAPVLVGYGSLLADCGRTKEARERLEEAIRVAEETGEEDWVMRALIVLGDLAIAEQRYEEAMGHYRRAEKSAAERNMLIPRINAQQGVMRVVGWRGDKERLAGEAKTLEELLSGLDNPQAEFLRYEARALVAWSEGRFDEARELFGKVLEYAREENRTDYLRWVLHSLIDLATEAGSDELRRWRREKTEFEQAVSEQFSEEADREAFFKAPVLYPAWAAS
jgi:tetratricopeptide (TPR) repeat protein